MSAPTATDAVASKATCQCPVSPLGPYPSADTATVFIVQSTAGQSKNFLEARLDVVVRNKRSHVSVVRREELLYKLDAVSVAGSDSIVSVVTKAIATARKQKSL